MLVKQVVMLDEPIIASYKLYTRLRSETTITDAPSFNGFSVSDLDVNNNAAQLKNIMDACTMYIRFGKCNYILCNPEISHLIPSLQITKSLL